MSSIQKKRKEKRRNTPVRIFIFKQEIDIKERSIEMQDIQHPTNKLFIRKETNTHAHIKNNNIYRK